MYHVSIRVNIVLLSSLELTTSTDATYCLWILTALEPLLGAMCASAPPLKIFMRKISAPRRGSNFFSYDPWGRSHESAAAGASASMPSGSDEEAIHDIPQRRQSSWLALKEKLSRRSPSDERGTDTTANSDHEVKRMQRPGPSDGTADSVSHGEYSEKKQAGGLWSHYVEEVPEEPVEGGTWYRPSIDD